MRVRKNNYKPSATLTLKKVAEIKTMLINNVLQHRIAAHFDVNAGRISEINTGKTFRDVLPA